MKKLSTLLAVSVFAVSTSVLAIPFEGQGLGHGVKPTPNVPVPEVPPTSDGKLSNVLGTNAVCVGISWDVAPTYYSPYLDKLATESEFPLFPSTYGNLIDGSKKPSTNALCVGISWDVVQSFDGDANYTMWSLQAVYPDFNLG